jgi:transcriptional regulator with XRE-family HTH domain
LNGFKRVKKRIRRRMNMDKCECFSTELDNEGVSEDFGKLIKEYRLMRGYSLAQLEKLAKVSPSYISRIERNLRTEVSFSRALRICHSLGIPYNLMISKAFGEIKLEEIEEDVQTLDEIIFHNDFYVHNKKVVDPEVKNAIVALIKFIFNCTWDSKTKVHDLFQISKKIEELKANL